MTKHTRQTACATVARDLREFGYPDVTGPMIEEVLTAWLKNETKMPHGIVGMMAKRQFDEIEDTQPGILASLSEAA